MKIIRILLAFILLSTISSIKTTIEQDSEQQLTALKSNTPLPVTKAQQEPDRAALEQELEALIEENKVQLELFNTLSKSLQKMTASLKKEETTCELNAKKFVSQQKVIERSIEIKEKDIEQQQFSIGLLESQTKTDQVLIEQLNSEIALKASNLAKAGADLIEIDSENSVLNKNLKEMQDLLKETQLKVNAKQEALEAKKALYSETQQKLKTEQESISQDEETIRIKESRIKEMTVKLEKMQTDAQAKNAELLAKKEELGNFEKMYDENKTTFEALNKEVSEMKEKLENWNQLIVKKQAEISTLEKEVRTLKASMMTGDKLLTEKEREVINEIAELQNKELEINDLAQKLSRKNLEKGDLIKESKTLQDQLAAIQPKSLANDAEISTVQAQISALMSETAELQKKVDLDASLEKITQDIQDMTNNLIELKANYEKNSEEGKKNFQILLDEKTELDKKIADFEQALMVATTSKEVYNKQLVEVSAKAGELTNNINDYQKQIDELKQKYQSAENAEKYVVQQ